MVCPQCGQSISVDAKICPYCGHVLRVSGLRVRHSKEGDTGLMTAKRTSLTPTHPRPAPGPSATVLTDTADPWQNEWMGTAKRPLPVSGADASVTRRYLVPGIVAALVLVACGGIALLLHGALFASSHSPVPVSATTTSLPTATLNPTSTIAPTATTAAYTPPRHAATATPPPVVPTATSTAPVVIVTTTVNPEPTVTATETKTATPTVAPKP